MLVICWGESQINNQFHICLYLHNSPQHVDLSLDNSMIREACDTDMWGLLFTLLHLSKMSFQSGVNLNPLGEGKGSQLHQVQLPPNKNLQADQYLVDVNFLLEEYLTPGKLRVVDCRAQIGIAWPALTQNYQRPEVALQPEKRYLCSGRKCWNIPCQSQGQAGVIGTGLAKLGLSCKRQQAGEVEAMLQPSTHN